MIDSVSNANLLTAPHVILGTYKKGFLQEHNCMIDFKKKCLHYGNSRLPFVKVERVKLAPRLLLRFILMSQIPNYKPDIYRQWRIFRKCCCLKY